MALPRPFKEDGPEQCYCLLAVRCRPSRDSAYKPQLLNRKESRSEEPNRRRPLANLKTLVHEQFGPYGKGGQFEPHAVGPVRLKCTGCHKVCTVQVQCCFTSTETTRTIRDGEPRTAACTFTYLLSSGVILSHLVYKVTISVFSVFGFQCWEG